MRWPGFLLRWAVARRFARTSFILIVAPMRSGSTLLQHLLAQVDGYLMAGETHVTYRSPADLERLMRRVYRFHGTLGAGATCVVDKCVTDELVPDVTLGGYPRTRLIFLLRDPAATVASLAALTKWRHGGSAASAAAYYVQHLARMVDLAAHVPDPSRAFFVTYEDLVDRTPAALAALTAFLALRAPLRERYETQEWTGVLARGDLSENIKRGEIVRHGRRTVELPPAIRAQIEAAHAAAAAAIAARCTGLPADASLPCPAP